MPVSVHTQPIFFKSSAQSFVLFDRKCNRGQFSYGQVEDNTLRFRVGSKSRSKFPFPTGINRPSSQLLSSFVLSPCERASANASSAVRGIFSTLVPFRFPAPLCRRRRDHVRVRARTSMEKKERRRTGPAACLPATFHYIRQQACLFCSVSQPAYARLTQEVR